MASKIFNDHFWDWAAYDLNWINIAAQERWLNGKGCPLDCNEKNIDRLHAGLQAYLNECRPETGLKLFDLLKILDKYRGDHRVPQAESDKDHLKVCRLIGEIMEDLPELKARRLTLQDWVDNGNARNIAVMTGQELPPPVLAPPAPPLIVP